MEEIQLVLVGGEPVRYFFLPVFIFIFFVVILLVAAPQAGKTVMLRPLVFFVVVFTSCVFFLSLRVLH